MTAKNLVNEIEEITNGEKFITNNQLEELQLLENLYIENCGISGTGKGTLYTLYEMDQNGDKTDNEVGEVVVMVDITELENKS